MSAYGLFCDLRRRGIEVRVVDGRLTAEPAASLTVRDRDDLRKYDREVRALLPYMFSRAEIVEREKWAEASRRYWAAPECTLCDARHSGPRTRDFTRSVKRQNRRREMEERRRPREDRGGRRDAHSKP